MTDRETILPTRGLEHRYEVWRLRQRDLTRAERDGGAFLRPVTREPVTDCFVLRPDRDPAALEALIAYALATPNDALALDLFAWARTCGYRGDTTIVREALSDD